MWKLNIRAPGERVDFVRLRFPLKPFFQSRFHAESFPHWKYSDRILYKECRQYTYICSGHCVNFFSAIFNSALLHRRVGKQISILQFWGCVFEPRTRLSFLRVVSATLREIHYGVNTLMCKYKECKRSIVEMKIPIVSRSLWMLDVWKAFSGKYLRFYTINIGRM